MITRRGMTALVAIACCWSWGAVFGDEPHAPAAETETPQGHLNAPTPTLGGKQLWSDELVFHDWRIQRNALTQHCRLLDDRDVRRAWGTFDECCDKLEALKRELSMPPVQGKAVVVLHGLGRSRQSMAGLCGYLKEHSDYAVINVSYASTRGDLSEHAASLARVIEHLEDVDEVNFVAHSLGNLVIRHYLADRTRAGEVRLRNPPLGRIVMIAPPNNGAKLAERFRKNAVFQTIWGQSGREIADHWESLAPRLATPQCQFGIIAGGRGDASGGNPLLDGDDDFIVSVDETRLLGARDFLVVPALHAVIMDDRKVQEYTLRFLQHGHFISPQKRQPIVSVRHVSNVLMASKELARWKRAPQLLGTETHTPDTPQ